MCLAELPITTSKPSRARQRAATLALVATVLLTVAKLIVALATGSIGVLSEAIHSGLDLISSLVTFFVVRVSVRPADFDHPFGHGKIESLSALFEAFLLLVAGAYIAYESIAAVLPGAGHIHEIQQVSWGLAVLGVSIVVNIFVYIQNRGVARREESIAIETNAFHFLTDVFSSLAVFIGLAAVKLTGWVYFDVIAALIIAVYVVAVGVAQIKKCVDELSDTVLPPNEVKTIQTVLSHHAATYLSYHDLKTRKAGAARFIDLHLEVCSDERVEAAHQVCDAIEEDLHHKFKEAQINIHVEPCGNHGVNCSKTCVFLNRLRAKSK